MGPFFLRYIFHAGSIAHVIGVTCVGGTLCYGVDPRYTGAKPKMKGRFPSTLYTALLAVILGKLQHGLSREK